MDKFCPWLEAIWPHLNNARQCFWILCFITIRTDALQGGDGVMNISDNRVQAQDNSKLTTGRIVRPALLHHLSWCTMHNTQSMGNDLLCVLHCPHFSKIRALPSLFQYATGS